MGVLGGVGDENLHDGSRLTMGELEYVVAAAADAVVLLLLLSADDIDENGFGEYISPTRRRSPKMATASLTELNGREVSTVEELMG